MRVLVLLCVLVRLSAAPGPVAGADRSCADLRQFYTGKGFTLVGVPQTEISGNHLSLSVSPPVFHPKDGQKAAASQEKEMKDRRD
eukprot:superscaffoldBa00004176_g18411